MSTTAGVLSETLLNRIRMRISDIMFDDRKKQDYITNMATIEAIRAVQTANVKMLETYKQNELEVWWTNVCGNAVEDDVACVVGGSKPSTNVKRYTIDRVKKVDFTVSEHDYINNEENFENAIAMALLDADRLLIEEAAQYFVSVLNTNAGVNAMGTASKGVVVGNDTFIIPAYWDATLMAYFLRTSTVNKFTQPILLSGANLNENYAVAQFNSGNDNGKGAVAMYNAMKIYFDLFNIETVNTPDLVTYMLSKGSVAMASRNIYKPQLEKFDDYSRFAMPSVNVPGVSFDVMVKQVCENNLTRYDYKVMSNIELFVNPVGCDEDNTGILTFTCGTGS